MTFILASSIEPQPWKNGGGTQRELLLRPSVGPWQIRVAVAEIEADGPFSEFAGVERWFSVLHGKGVELSIGAPAEAARHRLTSHDAALHFAGEAATRCRRLDGKVQALNLMLRGVQGRIELVEDGEDWTPQASSCGIYAVVAGRCNGVDLPAGALLWFDDAPARLSFVASEPARNPIGRWLAASPLEAVS